MYKRISISDCYDMVKQSPVNIVDVRDFNSFTQSHLKSAVNLNNENLADFVSATDKTVPLVVYCYHGNSSQQAGQYLEQQGFENVYSMDGGFEAWKLQYDVEA